MYRAHNSTTSWKSNIWSVNGKVIIETRMDRSNIGRGTLESSHPLAISIKYLETRLARASCRINSFVFGSCFQAGILTKVVNNCDRRGPWRSVAPVSGTFRMDIVQARVCDWGGFDDKATLYWSLVSSIESKIPCSILDPIRLFPTGWKGWNRKWSNTRCSDGLCPL